MEGEEDVRDNMWRARLDAILMHKVWGSLIFLGLVYLIFFLTLPSATLLSD